MNTLRDIVCLTQNRPVHGRQCSRENTVFPHHHGTSFSSDPGERLSSSQQARTPRRNPDDSLRRERYHRNCRSRHHFQYPAQPGHPPPASGRTENHPTYTRISRTVSSAGATAVPCKSTPHPFTVHNFIQLSGFLLPIVCRDQRRLTILIPCCISYPASRTARRCDAARWSIRPGRNTDRHGDLPHSLQRDDFREPDDIRS